MRTTREILETAKNAAKTVSLLTTEEKNKALSAMADEIEAEADGVILEVLVENGSPVEFGQPLFVLG